MTVEQEAQILLNNEVRVTFAKSQLFGQTGIVEGIMADGRTLDVKLSNGKNAFLDVTFVGEIQESVHSTPRPSKASAQTLTVCYHITDSKDYGN